MNIILLSLLIVMLINIKMCKMMLEKLHSRFISFGSLIALLSFLIIISLSCSHKKPFISLDQTTDIRISQSEESLIQRIIFIGDAGNAVEGDPVMESLYLWGDKQSSKTLVVFLGDNIYPRGLVSEQSSGRKKSEKYLQAQMNAVKKSGARGLFIPGNHDWAKGGETGKASVLRQEMLVRGTMQQDSVFLPSAGCPGPVAIDLPGIRLIVMDTDYWINDNIQWTDDCGINSEQQFLQELESLILSRGTRQVVLAGHHPLQTHGTHGGFFDWQDHIFPLTREIKWLWLPLPIIGSLYPLGREYIVKSDEDLVGKNYRHMLQNFRRVLNEHTPLAYFSGHDHNLQVLEGDMVQYMLVSGAGSIPKIMPVGDGEDTLFAYSHAGFMVLDVHDNGLILLKVIEPPAGKVVYTRILTD